MFFDSHTHGYYSYDSDAQYEQMIAAAKGQGLSGIYFTDHFEYVPDVGKLCGFEMIPYLSKIRSFSENASPSGFRVFSGIEFGLFDNHMEAVEFAMKNFKFDVIIGSVHYLPKQSDPYYPEYTADKDKFTAYSAILEKYIELLPKYKRINVMGHFDYVSRYSQSYEDRNMYYKDFPDHFDKLFTILIDNGIALEINTSTYQKRDSFPANQLDINVLKRYKELGGYLVTLGSDAHDPSHVGQGFQEVAELVKSAGIRYLTHFVKRKPVLERI